MRTEDYRILARQILDHLRNNPDQHTHDAMMSVADLIQKASSVFGKGSGDANLDPMTAYRKAFENLPSTPDWDSYGARPITNAAKKAAMAFLVEALAGRLQIAPTCRGGIALSMTHKDEELDVEIDHDGTQWYQD